MKMQRRSGFTRRNTAAVTLVMLILALLVALPVAAGDMEATDNGDGTHTLVFRPSGGANDGSDAGGLYGGKDAFVIRTNGTDGMNNNYGNAPTHHTFNSNCNTWTAQSYFQWDVSDLPAAADVEDVRLVFNHQIFRSYGWPYQISPTTMVVRAPTGPWNEMTLTMNNQPAIAPAILASVNLPTTIAGYTGPAVLDITDLYKEWRSDARPNYGIVYSRSQAFCENANASYVFSSDHPDPTLRPRLEITYRAGASDDLPPVTTAAVSPSANAYGWHAGDVIVTLTAADEPDGSGVAAIRYWLDGGAEVSVNDSSAQVEITVAGEHTLTYSAMDNAGNAETPKSLDIRIDITPPAITFTGNQGTYAVDEQVDITCSATDDLSGVASDTCYGVSGMAYEFGPGTHTLSATAVDRAGNSGAGSTSFDVVVTFDGLARLTRQFVTKDGVANSLVSKLNAAAAASARGNHTAVDGLIGAYINQLSAQSGKALSPDQATLLIILAADL